MIYAATIMGLHTLHLLYETTATFLAYGIYEIDLTTNHHPSVAFIDVGHVSMQYCDNACCCMGVAEKIVEWQPRGAIKYLMFGK